MNRRIKRFIVIPICFLIISTSIASAVQLSLTFDPNGNLITGDGKYREYNEFNQLVRIRDGNDISAHILEEYIYHPTDDRILLKRIYNETNVSTEAVVYIENYFVRSYDLKGIREINDTYYVKDYSGLIGEINYNGTDHTPIFTQGKKLYYHPDHLGSTTVITNQSGLVVEQMFYGPYGEILSGGDVSRFSYEGKEFSSRTDDYDFHFRKYNPELGIFTQPDALISNAYDPQSLNKYSFERRNPYKYVDPTGKCIEDLCFAEGIIISYAVATAPIWAPTLYQYSLYNLNSATDSAFEGPSAVNIFWLGLAGLDAASPLIPEGKLTKTAFEVSEEGAAAFRNVFEKTDDVERNVRHLGLLKPYKDRPIKSIERAIKSLEGRIIEHNVKMDTEGANVIEGVISHWRSEVNTWKEEINVLKNYLKSKGGG